MPKLFFPRLPNRVYLLDLAAEAGVWYRTVRRWYHGRTMQPRMLDRANDAARRPGVEPRVTLRAKEPTGGTPAPEAENAP